MRYIIISTCQDPFYTEWFEPENHLKPEHDMVVIDLFNQLFTKDGKEWHVMEEDSL